MLSQRAGTCQWMVEVISVDLCNVIVDLSLILVIQSLGLQALQTVICLCLICLSGHNVNGQIFQQRLFT